jgi:hypothetical protein
VDVNPSIQFTLNRYDQVLKVTAINSDAQPIVKTLGSQGVTHKSIRNAVEITIDNLASEHYFDDGGYLLIAAASKNTVKAEKLTHMLTQTALETGPETLTVKALIGELAQAQIADEKGISLGRQELLEQLMCGANPAQPFSYDEWRNKSVEELIRSAEQSATQFGDERPAFSGSANTQAPQQYSEETGKNQPLTQPEATEAPSQSGDQADCSRGKRLVGSGAYANSASNGYPASYRRRRFRRFAWRDAEREIPQGRWFPGLMGYACRKDPQKEIIFCIEGKTGHNPLASFICTAFLINNFC